jgi:predicted nucleotidyltransferase
MTALNDGIQIDLPMDQIADFCRRWNITELALFGSVLRDDFRPESDVDVLVTFAPDARHSLRNLLKMQDEIEAVFGRAVDLLDRESIEQSRNYIRRREILRTARTVYAV